jgi:hypothetical protein
LPAVGLPTGFTGHGLSASEGPIVRVPIDTGADGATRIVVAGTPSTNNSSDPQARGWARGPQTTAGVAYVTTDGGHTAIEHHRAGTDGIIRPARVVRAQFDAETGGMMGRVSE